MFFKQVLRDVTCFNQFLLSAAWAGGLLMDNPGSKAEEDSLLVKHVAMQ